MDLTGFQREFGVLGDLLHGPAEVSLAARMRTTVAMDKSRNVCWWVYKVYLSAILLALWNILSSCIRMASNLLAFDELVMCPGPGP